MASLILTPRKFLCFLGHFSYNLMWSDKGRDTVDEACKEKKEEVINCLVEKKMIVKMLFLDQSNFFAFLEASKICIPKSLFSCFCQKLEVFCSGLIFSTENCFLSWLSSAQGLQPWVGTSLQFGTYLQASCNSRQCFASLRGENCISWYRFRGWSVIVI